MISPNLQQQLLYFAYFDLLGGQVDGRQETIAP